MSVIFINSHRGKSGVLFGEKLPEAYVLACKFFDCGIMDRTGTLDQGFDYRVLDPIPASPPADEAFDPNAAFAATCDAVAGEIVQRALAEDREIRVLWSGGIDSTVALIALIKNLPPAEHHRLVPLLNMVSINEYPLFFRNHILRKLPFQQVPAPITNHFGSRELIVTGEHGDQLFGSDKLLPFISNGLAFEPWEDVLPLHLFDKFGKGRKVDILMEYLRPQFAASEQPLRTTFELFWWLNYSLKWQQVSLRLPVFTFRDDVAAVFNRTHHFFRDEGFQRWSLANHPNRACAGLTSYKQAAKAYIYDFTGDEEYLTHKTKEPSLKHVILDRRQQGATRYRIAMTEDFNPVIETFHKHFKNQQIV
ncbi:hypothetical protein [Lewinella sp. W8]|uniref:hypothetical protein n=1 Tax=Lewinella sp. W8 TaxID=2528208 RepID=UPI001067F5EF|nr:hypothetical protein [Lewinella sp. W8]MTB53565.1 hypothetical protein [Lewinella sp. W8]